MQSKFEDGTYFSRLVSDHRIVLRRFLDPNTKQVVANIPFFNHPKEDPVYIDAYEAYSQLKKLWQELKDCELRADRSDTADTNESISLLIIPKSEKVQLSETELKSAFLRFACLYAFACRNPTLFVITLCCEEKIGCLSPAFDSVHTSLWNFLSTRDYKSVASHLKELKITQIKTNIIQEDDRTEKMIILDIADHPDNTFSQNFSQKLVQKFFQTVREPKDAPAINKYNQEGQSIPRSPQDDIRFSEATILFYMFTGQLNLQCQNEEDYIRLRQKQLFMSAAILDDVSSTKYILETLKKRARPDMIDKILYDPALDGFSLLHYILELSSHSLIKLFFELNIPLDKELNVSDARKQQNNTLETGWLNRRLKPFAYITLRAHSSLLAERRRFDPKLKMFLEHIVTIDKESWQSLEYYPPQLIKDPLLKDEVYFTQQFLHEQQRKMKNALLPANLFLIAVTAYFLIHLNKDIKDIPLEIFIFGCIASISLGLSLCAYYCFSTLVLNHSFNEYQTRLTINQEVQNDFSSPASNNDLELGLPHLKQQVQSSRKSA